MYYARREAILARSGVTKGAMYHHFADKEALGHAVIDDVIATIMREKWQLPLQQAENPIDALIAIVRSTSPRVGYGRMSFGFTMARSSPASMACCSNSVHGRTRLLTKARRCRRASQS